MGPSGRSGRSPHGRAPWRERVGRARSGSAAVGRKGLGQLEQFVRVARPGRAGLLEQRAHDALVAGQGIGVGLRRGRARRRAARLEHRDADARARARLQRGAPARAVAVVLEVERDRADTVRRTASAARKSAASSTALLPHETTVCSRRPRRAPSALTATLPLCDTSATGPGSAGATASPHSAQRSGTDTMPLPFGPHTAASPPRRVGQLALSASPPGASPKPAANTTAPPQPSAPACSTTAGADAAGIATTTASTASGRASSDGKQGAPPTAEYFGFTA